MPQSKHGRTVLKRSVELRNKIRDRILAFLSEPLVRDFLYWLLCVCLCVEEYLIRLLIEEG